MRLLSIEVCSVAEYSDIEWRIKLIVKVLQQNAIGITIYLNLARLIYGKLDFDIGHLVDKNNHDFRSSPNRRLRLSFKGLDSCSVDLQHRNSLPIIRFTALCS